MEKVLISKVDDSVWHVQKGNNTVKVVYMDCAFNVLAKGDDGEWFLIGVGLQFSMAMGHAVNYHLRY